MNQPGIKQLRKQTPTGYNLAVVVPLEHNINNMDVFLCAAVPVLKKAVGALGVLRAMDLPGKRQGIQKEMAYTGKEYRLLHLVFLEDEGLAVLHDYRFKLIQE